MDKGGASPDACPICLERVEMEAYLDQCFHRFCFSCILQWSETRLGRPPACPICKAPYSSVIHNFQQGGHFDRLPVSEFSVGIKPWDLPSSSSQPGSGSGGERRAVFVPSEAHKRRRQVYARGALAMGDLSTEPHLPAPPPAVRGPNLLYGTNGTRAARVHEWLTTELQALMLEHDVALVVAHVEACIRAAPSGEGSPAWSGAIAFAVQPFVGSRAPKFVQELAAFMRAGPGQLASNGVNAPSPHSMPPVVVEEDNRVGGFDDSHVGGWDDM